MFPKNIKLAIVCDWLTNFGGAEKIIIALHQLFPNAPIYTSIYNREKMKGFEDADIRTSYLQNLPFAKTRHQLYLPFFPQVFEKMDLSDFDIVISSSHSCAKGIITKPETLHICYCHTPMRYAWDDSLNYIKGYSTNLLVKKLAKLYVHRLRIWDRLSADRVDNYIANSHYVQQRIFKYYRRPSTVIHPYVDVSDFNVGTVKDKFYLAVGRLTPYKKFDLIIETFNQLGLPLKIAGDGVAMKQLKNMAKSNIEFLGQINDVQLRELYGKARALIFPQVEDFGITPLEAMASGCPVIAYARGGALETVLDRKSGLFFYSQSVESLRHAIYQFQEINFKYSQIRKQAEKFDRERFNGKILEFISEKWQHHTEQINKN
jgi:glycosyltransferase involved in cell wall biosynthesis